MNYRKFLSGGASLGLGMIYLLDRQAGRRRRAIIRDKAVRGAHLSQTAGGKIQRDLRNRLQGIAAGLKGAVSGEKVSDHVLAERVRSAMGTVVSHPGSVNVEALDGRVKLTGLLLTAELPNLLKTVKAVRGVREVTHEMGLHDQPGNVPGLQGDGSGRTSGSRFELLQENWSPAARLLTGTAGASLLLYGLFHRRLSGAAATAAGVPLFTRALTNMPLRRIVGAAGRRAVDVDKTITIGAPLEEVFEAFLRVEEFPRFMANVKKVSRQDEPEEIYHWTVAGPAGMEVTWYSRFTSVVPNQQLAWKSLPKSMVQHAGIAKFTSNPDGGTAVHIRLSYNPLIGGIGHALLTLLGADPKTLLDEDLLRTKTFIETGKQPRDAAARRG